MNEYRSIGQAAKQLEIASMVQPKGAEPHPLEKWRALSKLAMSEYEALLAERTVLAIKCAEKDARIAALESALGISK